MAISNLAEMNINGCYITFRKAPHFKLGAHP